MKRVFLISNSGQSTMSKVSFLKQENWNRIQNTTCRQSPLFSFPYSAVLPGGLLVSCTRQTSNLAEEGVRVNVLWVFDDAAVPGISLGVALPLLTARVVQKVTSSKHAVSMSHFPMSRSGNLSEHSCWLISVFLRLVPGPLWAEQQLQLAI